VAFIVLAQWLCAFFLDYTSTLETIKTAGVYWLMLGTTGIAFYGYWLNDFLDIDRDKINKTTTKGIAALSRYAVYVHLLLFISLVLFSANYLPLAIRIIFLVSLTVLSIYNLFLKNVAGIGNFLIATLAFTSIFCVVYIFPAMERLLLLHFAVLSGALTFSREVVKDEEDMEGDKATNAHTIPVLFGIKNANNLVYMILLFTIAFSVVSLYHQYDNPSFTYKRTLLYTYYTYYALFIMLPLFQMCVKAQSAKAKSDFTAISRTLKYVLFMGVLSILFF
jgi:4-hydroxybenzoate polyprenyltransferase